jgi:hypothetical protein
VKTDRDINALIGEKIMGYQWFTYEGRKEDGTITFKFKGLAPNKDYWDRQFEITKEHNYLEWVDEEPKDLKLGSYYGADFTTKLTDAWAVLDEVCKKNNWRAIIDRNQTYSEVTFKTQMGGWVQHHAESESMMMAICLACLDSVGISSEQLT